MDSVDFQVALGAVKHFGKNLYTSNPPAIAELIANAWDAYAKKCQIIVFGQEMVIVDDGIGMTDEELTERYAKSGFEKNLDVRKPAEMKARSYMGKKGIGKFSAFSLSDSYTIITKSEQDKDWKKITLDYDKLYTDQIIYKAQVDHVADPTDLLPQTLVGPEVPTTSGTIIILPQLKRAINKTTEQSLKDLIAKRFSSSYFGPEADFQLIFNFEKVTPINLREHFFYSKVEYVLYFGKTLAEMKLLFPNVKTDNFKETSNDFLTGNAKGWLGSVEKPADLQTENETSVSGVSVYIHGKIADENIFKNSADGRIPNAYLVGEVDFSPSDDKEDPVLSGREGLNHELESVQRLKSGLLKVRGQLIDGWNSMRAQRPDDKQDYLTKIKKNPDFLRAFSSYDEKEKKRFTDLAERVFDRPGEKDEQDIPVLAPAIFQIVNDKTLNEVSADLGKSAEEVLELFAKLFNVAEINHALRMQSNVNNRLNIIKELEKFIQEEEVEKVFEKHLAANPWLINPSWDIRGSHVSTQDRFSYLNIDNSESQVRTDIIIETAQELLPIIVEIKRSKKTAYSCPNVESIQAQINTYRKAIKEHLVKMPDSSLKGMDIFTIKAFFVCGSKEKDQLSADDLSILERNKIDLVTYDSLLEIAKNTYSVFDVSEEHQDE